MSTKSLIICADGYAQTDGSSQIIRTLLERGRINATSCLVMGEGWARNAQACAPVTRDIKNVSVGLHLDLSRFNPQGVHIKMPTALLALSIMAASSSRDEDRLFAQFRRQWDEFVAHFGRAPDFIDSHRHVHLLPTARRALFRLIRETGFRGWVRQCRMSAKRGGLKAILLNLLSGALVRDAIHHDVPINPGFGGLRQFRRDEAIEDLWAIDLAAMRFGGLLIVHPGSRDGDDRMSAYRAQEARSLNSERVQALMESAHLRFPFTNVVPWMRTYSDPHPRMPMAIAQPQAAE